MFRGSELVAKAGEISRVGHAGQMYGDVPYYEHPLSVAKLAEASGYNAEVIAACLLHDTVEDTPITLEHLLEQGMPGIVVDAVASMTYLNDGSETMGKIEKARSHPLGHVGKFFDSSRNLSRNTFHDEVMSFEQRLERIKLYTGNVALLLPDLPMPEDIDRFTQEYYDSLRIQQVA